MALEKLEKISPQIRHEDKIDQTKLIAFKEATATAKLKNASINITSLDQTINQTQDPNTKLSLLKTALSDIPHPFVGPFATTDDISKINTKISLLQNVNKLITLHKQLNDIITNPIQTNGQPYKAETVMKYLDEIEALKEANAYLTPDQKVKGSREEILRNYNHEITQTTTAGPSLEELKAGVHDVVAAAKPLDAPSASAELPPPAQQNNKI